MVRIKISLGIVIAIIVLSVSGIFVLDYKTDRVLKLLEETRSYSDEGDNEKALEAVKRHEDGYCIKDQDLELVGAYLGRKTDTRK